MMSGCSGDTKASSYCTVANVLKRLADRQQHYMVSCLSHSTLASVPQSPAQYGARTWLLITAPVAGHASIDDRKTTVPYTKRDVFVQSCAQHYTAAAKHYQHVYTLQ